MLVYNHMLLSAMLCNKNIVRREKIYFKKPLCSDAGLIVTATFARLKSRQLLVTRLARLVIITEHNFVANNQI